MAFLLLVGLLNGCDTETIVLAEQCDVVLTEFSPDEGSTGSTVQAFGRPMSTIWDTAMYLGGQRAAILDVGREDCENCDSCRKREGCDACDDCDECDAVCNDCVQFVTFVVPESEPGNQWVTMYNQHGQTPPRSFHVTAGLDTGTSDSGTSDSGTSDSGTSDSGTSDSGTSDSGTSDSGTSDSGTSDSGTSDSGTSDSGTSDSGTTDG